MGVLQTPLGGAAPPRTTIFSGTDRANRRSAGTYRSSCSGFESGSRSVPRISGCKHCQRCTRLLPERIRRTSEAAHQIYGPVAQCIEQVASNHQVIGEIPMCSLRPLTCLQVQVLPRQWMVGPSSDSRPWLGETPAGASSAVNGRACQRREPLAGTGQPL